MTQSTTDAPHESLFLPQETEENSADHKVSGLELPRDADTPIVGADPQGDGGSQFIPEAPTTLAETGLSGDNLLALSLKALSRCELNGNELSGEIKIAFSIVEPIIEAARAEQLIEVRSSSGIGTAGYRYGLTVRGRERAAQHFESNGYVGAAPVPLDQYVRYVEEVRRHKTTIDQQVIASGFKELIVSDDMLDQLGPAVNARRAMFLYGPPGNGKSVMSAGIGRALGGAIYMPYALNIGGDAGIGRALGGAIYMRTLSISDRDPVRSGDARAAAG